jgi:CheY-like chemotaxis protein
MLNEMKQTKSILLVEDDLDDQGFFIEALSEIKNANLYYVARNGREALERLNNSDSLPDLIFTDIDMPLMNGLDCLTAVVRSPQLRNIPVVMLTGSTGQMEISRQLGAKGFIKKPGNLKTLRMSMEQMINQDFVFEGLDSFHTCQSGKV